MLVLRMHRWYIASVFGCSCLHASPASTQQHLLTCICHKAASCAVHDACAGSQLAGVQVQHAPGAADAHSLKPCWCRARVLAAASWQPCERSALLLLKGKQGRSESPALLIQDALLMVLDAARVPCAISTLPQVSARTAQRQASKQLAAAAQGQAAPQPVASTADPGCCSWCLAQLGCPAP